MGLVQTYVVSYSCVACFADLLRSYPQLVGTRVVLGAVEAGLFPGVTW